MQVNCAFWAGYRIRGTAPGCEPNHTILELGHSVGRIGVSELAGKWVTAPRSAGNGATMSRDSIERFAGTAGNRPIFPDRLKYTAVVDFSLVRKGRPTVWQDTTRTVSRAALDTKDV